MARLDEVATRSDITRFSTLLLHTDALVERRRDPDERVGGHLLDLVRAQAGHPPGGFRAHPGARHLAATDDDTAVPAVRSVP